MFENKDNQKDDRPRNRIKRPTLALAAGVLVMGLLAVAVGADQLSKAAAQSLPHGQNANSTSATPNYLGKYGQISTVSTSGTATTTVEPDKFSATIGVQTDGNTAADAASSNAKLMGKVVDALKALGIRDDQIATSNFNVYPLYGDQQQDKVCAQTYPLPPYCQPGQTVTGYRASNSVTVTLDTKGQIDAAKVIDTSVAAGANNVLGVTFFISQSEQATIRESLIKEAISDARHRADIAADSLGMHVSGVQSVSLNDVYFPIYARNMNYAAASALASTPIQPGQQDITTTVSTVFYLSENGASPSPSGMTATRDNTNCTNPPGGPMVC